MHNKRISGRGPCELMHTAWICRTANFKKAAVHYERAASRCAMRLVVQCSGAEDLARPRAATQASAAAWQRPSRLRGLICGLCTNCRWVYLKSKRLGRDASPCTFDLVCLSSSYYSGIRHGETLRLRLRLSLFLIPRLATKPHTSLDNDAQYCVKRDLRGYEDFLHTRPQTEDYS